MAAVHVQGSCACSAEKYWPHAKLDLRRLLCAPWPQTEPKEQKTAKAKTAEAKTEEQETKGTKAEEKKEPEVRPVLPPALR